MMLVSFKIFKHQNISCYNTFNEWFTLKIPGLPLHHICSCDAHRSNCSTVELHPKVPQSYASLSPQFNHHHVPPSSSIFQKCFKKFLVLRGKKFSKPQPRLHSNCDFSLSVTKICISSRTTAIILPLSLQQTLLALSCHQSDVKRKEAKTNSNLQKCNHRLWPNSSSAIHTQLSFEVPGSLWCSARMAPRLPQYQCMAESRAHFLLSVQ